MSTVYHKYVGANASVPEPPKDKKESVRQRGERAKWDTAFRRERTEHERIRRINSQVDLARKRHLLMDRAEVERRTSFFLVAFRERLLSFPRTLPRKLAGKSPHEMRLVIEAEVKLALSELADMPQRLCVAQELNDEQWLDQVTARASNE
jgi:hypothetical protein